MFDGSRRVICYYEKSGEIEITYGGEYVWEDTKVGGGCSDLGGKLSDFDGEYWRWEYGRSVVRLGRKSIYH